VLLVRTLRGSRFSAQETYMAVTAQRLMIHSLVGKQRGKLFPDGLDEVCWQSGTGSCFFIAKLSRSRDFSTAEVVRELPLASTRGTVACGRSGSKVGALTKHWFPGRFWRVLEESPGVGARGRCSLSPCALCLTHQPPSGLCNCRKVTDFFVVTIADIG
jgi:hypothetical protein